MRTLKASVIVPVYNGARTLERCLSALFNQSVPRAQYEVIVVDDDSTDNTSAMASRFPVRLLAQEHRGPAAARNLGIANASSEIVLFTDADTEPTHNWIETMLAPFFADPQLAGAKGTYRTQQPEWIARFVQIEYEEKYARMARARVVDVIDTYSAAYRRELFAREGGFDEAFPSASAEDREFSFRLAKKGYRLAFVPAAIVYHQHVTEIGAYCRRKFKYGYWNVRVHRQYPAKVVSDAHTPPTLKFQVITVLPLLVSGLFALEFPVAGLVFSLLMFAFTVSALPLMWRAWRRDFAVGLVAYFYIVCRAVSLAGGVCTGMIAEIFRNTWLGRAVFFCGNPSRASRPSGLT